MQSVTLVKEGGLVGHFQLQQPTGARAVEPLSQGTPRRRGSERGQLSHTQSHFNSTVSQGKVLETIACRQRGLGGHCTERVHTRQARSECRTRRCRSWWKNRLNSTKASSSAWRKAPKRRGSERGERGQLSHTQSHFNPTVSQGKVADAAG